MKIVVCIKQVPARDSVLRLNSAGTWVQEADLSFEVNEPDIYALEEGLRLKEKHGGEVVLATLGPARAQQAIKEALAKGADRALHLDDPAFATLDAFGIARALAKAIEKEKPDIVLTGLQSDDFGSAQTGVVLAEFLGLPHSTIIMEIQVEGGAVRVKRELEGGWFQWIDLPLPAVLTIQSGINKPRYATLKGIMAAKSKPVQKLTAADLGLSAQDLAPRQRIAKVYVPAKAAQTEFLQGSPKEIATRLVDKLKNDARVDQSGSAATRRLTMFVHIWRMRARKKRAEDYEKFGRQVTAALAQENRRLPRSPLHPDLRGAQAGIPLAGFLERPESAGSRHAPIPSGASRSRSSKPASSTKQFLSSSSASVSIPSARPAEKPKRAGKAETSEKAEEAEKPPAEEPDETKSSRPATPGPTA